MSADAAPEPRSWAQEVNGYRARNGCRSFSTVSAATEPVQRFVRTVPGICPLAELRHPLYAVGSSAEHVINTADGSLQRSQWHGWRDVSLLKQDGKQGQLHPRGMPLAAQGKKLAAPAAGKDGRAGLFGLLQGTEAGGPDAWIGNIQIDPTKGKRSVTAPTDNKRSVPLSQLLAQTAPGLPSDDGWLGNLELDPAKGKAHAPDPSSLRGRANLFEVLQQRILHQQQQQQLPANPALSDAWIGNRMIQPNKGKKPVEDSPAIKDNLFAATFRAGPAENGCWCDMPPVGKRPLMPPSDAAGFVSAAQTLRMEEPLPPGVVVGAGRPQGKAMVADPHGHAQSDRHVDMYTLMTFKPLTAGEAERYQHSFNDAAAQPKKRLLPGAAGAAASLSSQQPDFQPSRQMRFVPLGGIAQEKGQTVNTMALNRTQARGDGGGGSSSSGSAGGSTGGGRGTASKSGAGASSSSGGKAK